MKKIILCTALLLSFLSNTASADAINELQQRLQRIEVLSANYVQSVTDPQGKNIQQAQGKLQIKRPNLFRMETHSPQETQIISDGKSLWFYDPFVEQVTIHWVKEAINNTPFVLLTSDQTAHWKAYEVSQSADTFTLKPKSKQSHISAFSIRIDADGTLRNFSTQEKDGQVNLYLLRNITNQPLPNHLFSFTPSKGTEIDDQRKPSN